jgi:hypothetical protein
LARLVGKERIAENVHLFGLRPIPTNESGFLFYGTRFKSRFEKE